MEKKYRPGYKALLTSLTIATILTNARMQNVHATEEPFVNQIDVEKVILDKQLEKDLGIVDAPTDELFFNFDSSTGTITSYGIAGGSDVVIPKFIGGVQVKSIGYGAFKYKGITSIVIPDSVTSIGGDAFRKNQLTEVNIPDSVTSIGDSAFESNQLTELIIPASVTSIGDYAFYSNQLTEVIIPNSVTSIGDVAFSNNQLTEVIIPDSVTNIGDSAFSLNQLTKVIIPDSVTSIGGHAFRNNQLTEVNIPDSVTSIGRWAFESNQLTELIIPDSVINIGDHAFYSNQLTELIIPDSVTNIGDGAFYSNQLTELIIPDSVINIGNSAFRSNQLTELIIPDSVTSIGDYAFRSNQLTEVNIPDSVTRIGNSAFSFNQLTEVITPNSVTSIGDSAFSFNQLAEVTIPDSVTSIGGSAFSNNQLTEVNIPDSVTSIGGSAFSYNSSLKKVTIPSSVVFMGVDIFRGTSPNLLLYGESGSRAESYAKDFSHNFVDMFEIIVKEEIHMEEVDFETEYVQNPDLAVGTEEVSQEGAKGTRTIVEKVTTVAGKETGREVISSEITTAPVNKVIQVGTREVTEETRTEDVAFETEYVNNSDLLVGTEEVTQEGVLGERTIVEKVTTVGGEETAREVISDEITTAPVNKVIQVGTKAAPIEDIATVVSEESRTEEVAFEIEYVNNPDLLVGTEEVSQEGVLGERTIVEKVTTVGGEETGREMISDEITTAPVNKVVQVGTKAFEIEDTATVVTEETRTQEVAFEIEYVNNPDLLVGTEEVSQEGVLGERTIVEKVTTVGGEETGREMISDEITTAPVNKVVQVGTKAVKEESRTEELPFEIEYVNNPNLLIGTEKVSQEGVVGILTIIEEVTTIDGEEANRKVLSEEVTTAPVKKVVQVGTKAAVIEDIAKIKDGWKKEDNKWVYYKDNEKLNGWQFINSHWYYMNSSGAMQTGWTKVGSTWYYLSGSGAMQTGWTKVGNTWYYMNSSGAMQTDWTKVGNSWYYLSGSGAMQTGWTKVGNTWYYLSGSGAMQTGWTKVGNTWYYMNSSGAMQTGWTKVGNTWYYMNSSGAMQTGWTKVGNTWYYMSGNGAMQTGWLKLGRNWYFLNNDGSMQVQNKTINGKWYRFDSSGRML